MYVPANYNPAVPTALVLSFHGLDSSAVSQERYAGLQEKSEESGYLILSPEGTNDPRRWYISGPFEPGYTDDVVFVRALLDQVRSEYCIDGKRIYAMGISNGAGISALLGCALNDQLAAIALVAGSPYSNLCDTKGPMPVVIFHGTADLLVPFNGGFISLAPLSVRENLARWANHNGCGDTMRESRIADDVQVDYYESCTSGADTILYVIQGGGHTWPGADIPVLTLGKTTQSIDATDIIWDFFRAHIKQ